MTPTLEDHERRITVLEERMDQEAGLRASQDRDLAAIAEGVRAQDRLLKALAKTQSEQTQTLAQHTQTLTQHTQILAQHTQTLAQHTQTLDEHTQALAELKGGVSQIIGMISTLIERDERQ
jgi:ABC-type transporter Mla subunit MlaD